MGRVGPPLVLGRFNRGPPRQMHRGLVISNPLGAGCQR